MPVVRRLTIFKSLWAVLFLWLFAVVLTAFAAYAFLSVRATSREWRKVVESGALAWSELIQKATEQGMMGNHREDVHQVIRSVASTPGVVGVRIYDRRGTIAYSADEREIGRRVDRTAEACWTCHSEGQPSKAAARTKWTRVYRTPGGERVLGLINPIESSPSCASAGCHAPSQTVLGVLDVKMSLAGADRGLAAARNLSVTAAMLLALAVGGSSALFINRFVRRPVRSLIAGTERVARGDLSARFEVGFQNELGQLAEAFNRMTGELARVRAENEEWSRRLEHKVVRETEELSRTQRQVVHMEKMASLGTLAATVAHELNNPLAGILNYAKLVERSLAEGMASPGAPETPEDVEELLRFLRIIHQEAGRCGKIVHNFLVFARRSGGEFVLCALNPIVEQALAILRHHLEMKGVELSWTPVSGEGGDEIVCDAGQIQQALIDLFVNAIEAMPEGGTLTVLAREAKEGVEILVADTGVGIPDDALPHIFEPFYTTKQESGSGLGLSVVWGIVERHGGGIEVDSEMGKGTVFRLTLPRHPPPMTSRTGASGESHE